MNHEVTVDELFNVLSELDETCRIELNRFNPSAVYNSDGSQIGEIQWRTPYAQYVEYNTED